MSALRTSALTDSIQIQCYEQSEVCSDLKLLHEHEGHHVTWCCTVSLCSTCGLAEELEQESKGKQKTDLPKSACGSVSVYFQKPALVPHPSSGSNKEIIIIFVLFVAVLPWRCFPMCQLPVHGDAGVQAGRENRSGQQNTDGCLKHNFSNAHCSNLNTWHSSLFQPCRHDSLWLNPEDQWGTLLIHFVYNPHGSKYALRMFESCCDEI